MSSHSGWRDILLKAARETHLKSSAIEAALRNTHDDPPIACWIERNLTQSRLLTPEELAIWNFLEGRTVNPHQGIGSRTQDHVPLTEDDLEEAIQDLERSTESINVNVHALESQRSLISTSSDPSPIPNNNTSTFESGLNRKEAAQSQQLAFVNRDLVLELDGKLQLSRDGVDRYRKAINSTIIEKLRIDDRALEALEIALAKSNIDIHDSTVASDRTSSLITTLRYITTQWLKTRLDRVYLQELTSADLPNDNGDTQSDDIQQVEHDLQSLYTEIEDVTSMLMENEYRNELKSLAGETSAHAARAQANETREAVNKLEDATSSLNTLAQRYECLQVHRQILDHLERSLAQTKAKSVSISGSSRPAHVRHTSASRINHEPHRSDQLEALLRHMNIDGTREIVSDTSATSAALGRHSKIMAQQIRDLVHGLANMARTATATAQTQLQRLERGESTEQLDKAAEGIKKLDEQIADVRSEVDRAAETRYQDRSVDLARRLAERQ